MIPMSENAVRWWMRKWLAEKRPNEVMPFFIFDMLRDFQLKLEEMNRATDQREKPQDDQQKH